MSKKSMGVELLKMVEIGAFRAVDANTPADQKTGKDIWGEQCYPWKINQAGTNNYCSRQGRRECGHFEKLSNHGLCSSWQLEKFFPMKIRVTQIYLEEDCDYPFSFRFQRRMMDEISSRVNPSGTFIRKYAADFNIVF